MSTYTNRLHGVIPEVDAVLEAAKEHSAATYALGFAHGTATRRWLTRAAATIAFFAGAAAGALIYQL